MNTIQYASWHNWIFFPIVVIIIFVACYWLFKRRSAIKALIHHKAARIFVHHYSFVADALKVVLISAGSLTLFVALLQPQWDKKEEALEHKGRDLIIALDISRSMLCDDMHPDRLTCAKKKIHALVKQLSCERIGLILFAGAPFLVCPLTSDYDSFFMFLDQVDANTVSSGGTAISDAIKLTLQIFAKIPERKNKLLVIFTDGEDFSSSTAAIKEESIKAGLHIFAVGLGTQQGAPVPLYDATGKTAGYQKDAQGAVVISRLDEQLLQSLVNNSGGTYVHATDDTADLQAIVKQLNSFDKELIEEKKRDGYQEKYHIFALISFICFLIEWLL